MKFIVLYAILATIIGSSTSFGADYLEKYVKEDRIIGGKTAEPGQFPYQVSLRVRIILPGIMVYNLHLCGGSIISDRWIVSAAHCTQGLLSKSRNLVVAVGAHHIKNDGQIYYLNQIVNNPTYDISSKEGDISLLQTNKTIEFNKFVLPIPLRNEFVGAGVAATASGWGLVQLPTLIIKRPTYLQRLDVNTVTNQKCWTCTNEEKRRFINNGTLCTFTKFGEGMCFGDSGSPLVSSGQLIGVASWEFPCARGQPDAFTRISTFSEWIREVTGVAAV